MTTAEAARILRVSRRHLARMVSQNEIDAAHVPGGRSGVLVFDPAEVERVAALRAKKTETPK